MRRHLDWTIAVGALNPFACFTIVNGDALGAPRTNKGDSHPQRFNHKAPSVVKRAKQIEALTAGLQKVSAQLEVEQACAATVLNSQ